MHRRHVDADAESVAEAEDSRSRALAPPRHLQARGHVASTSLVTSPTPMGEERYAARLAVLAESGAEKKAAMVADAVRRYSAAEDKLVAELEASTGLPMEVIVEMYEVATTMTRCRSGWGVARWTRRRETRWTRRGASLQNIRQ